ncbi:MAG: DUF4962 domain-containing protein [Opitutaceae bacterium]
MKESRHPHPHVDPRQPRNNDRLGTNPPVFAWKPPAGEVRVRISGTHPPVYTSVLVESKDGYRLEVARDLDFADKVIDLPGLVDPVHLPEKALPAGGYFWRWSSGEAVSEVFSFTIPQDAVRLEVPPAETWLEAFSGPHPRVQVSAGDLPQLRSRLERDRPSERAAMIAEADAILKEAHHYPEPERLPDREVDYEAFWAIWYPTMWGTRRFVKGAEVLAFAYLVTGISEYGRAACQRLDSVARWDPEGSTYLGHNDEAHMSVIWNGPIACDWVWNLFTEEERTRVIEQYRRRGEITFHHMHDQGCYGVNRFDSHAGREIVFLAQMALVFHQEIPEAREWLRWLRPVLGGIWPVWAGDDGAWSEGVSYANPYVTIMSRFVSILKHGAGIDLYRRPFWKNFCKWKRWVQPPYAEWTGFGDHSERWRDGWTATADIVELIARETGSPEFLPYVAAFRREIDGMEAAPAGRALPATNPTLLLAPPLEAEPGREAADRPGGRVSAVFPYAGWAAIRTGLAGGSDDVAFLFRSSRFGAFSHSHSNNNDFIVHVGGRIMAMPSGYYAGYGSKHHAHWVWHTKANNCITLSDAPQLMRSHESQGYVINGFEDERIAYFCGNADASYRLQARRCRRHVAYLKDVGCFFLVDTFEAQPGITSSVQWNIHSWSPFAVDPDGKGFHLQRGESGLHGSFLFSHESFVSLREGWDPPPGTGKNSDQWHNQYHLRFTPAVLAEKRNLGVVLRPDYPGFRKPEIRRERRGTAEVAEIDGFSLWVNQEERMDVAGRESDAIAAIVMDGRVYEIREEGVAHRGQ